MTPEQLQEIIRCSEGADWSTAKGYIYWCNNYVQINDPQTGEWFPFELWPEQEDVAHVIFENQRTIGLKTRQVGMTWEVLSIGLYVMSFRPGSAVSMFSISDREAIYLLRERMKGQHARLPDWMQPRVGEPNSDHLWQFQSGSIARSFPATAGDSYTNTLVLIDEADLIPDLPRLDKAIEPTIDAGGKVVMISKSNKSKPKSLFKTRYRNAKAGRNNWKSFFLPWNVRPERTEEWYAEQCRATLADTGSLDDVHENYPATDEEALAPKSLDKRFASEWLKQCHEHLDPVDDQSIPAIKGFLVYHLPEEGRRYVIGADPAEGNPTSDDSALTVLDRETWEEVASLGERLEPGMFAHVIEQIAEFYNNAKVLIERNNHGHAVLLALRGTGIALKGEDKKPGHQTTAKSKVSMYDKLAEALHDGDMVIHNTETYLQLASLDGSTLSAPEGEQDDRAMSFALALLAARRPVQQIA